MKESYWALDHKTQELRHSESFLQSASHLSNLELMYGALINLLNSYVHGESRKNELYLGRHLDFFLTQIADAQVLTFNI